MNKVFEQRNDGLYIIKSRGEKMVVEGKISVEYDKSSPVNNARYIVSYVNSDRKQQHLKIKAKDCHGKKAAYDLAEHGLKIMTGSELNLMRFIVQSLAGTLSTDEKKKIKLRRR